MYIGKEMRVMAKLFKTTNTIQNHPRKIKPNYQMGPYQNNRVLTCVDGNQK
jgi:aspartyl/asparaginyl-tRNA synthetase